jgi:cytochrome c556
MTKRSKRSLVVLLLLSATGAAAAAPNVTAAIKARQANYKEIGGAFKAIKDELKSGSPNLAAIRQPARELASRAAQALTYFPRGSGPESGLKTRAKAQIWSEQAKFVALQQQMIAAAKTLDGAAAAGDVGRMQAARDSLGATCKSCHDRYREAD